MVESNERETQEDTRQRQPQPGTLPAIQAGRLEDVWCERALREYVYRLEYGSGQSGVLVGTNGTDESDDTGDDTADDTDSNNEADAKCAEASAGEVLDEYRQFATLVLDRSENTVDLHTRYIGRLLEHANKPPSRITQNDITTYLNSEDDVSNADEHYWRTPRVLPRLLR